MDRFRPSRIAVSYSRKKRRRAPRTPLEQAAEVENVRKPKLGRDLFDRLRSVQELPFGLLEEPFANQLGERLVQVRFDQPGQ